MPEQEQGYRLSWIAVVTGAVAALGLGIWGFEIENADRSLGDSLYLALQLFSLESGMREAPIGWQLNAARYLAFATVTAAAIKGLLVVLRGHLDAWRLGRLREHTIVCGLGRKGYALTRSLREHGEPVVVVEIDEGNDLLGNARGIGAFVLVGQAAEEEMLEQAGLRRAKRLVALTGDDSANLEIAMHGAHASTITGRELDCHVHLRDSDLCAQLAERGICSRAGRQFQLRTFNSYRNSARLLCVENLGMIGPVQPEDSRALQVIIVGFGAMGEALAREVALQGHFAGSPPPQLHVIDHRADELVDRFLSRSPQFEQAATLQPITGAADDPRVQARMAQLAADNNGAAMIAYCLDGDHENFSAAYRLLPHLDAAPDVPVYVRLGNADGIARLLEEENTDDAAAKRLHGFGMLSKVCRKETVFGGELDRLARKIHEDYLKNRLADGDEMGCKPAMHPWEELTEPLRDMNRHPADHMPIKIATYEAMAGRDEDERRLILARLEHRRWCAEHYVDGWQEGPRDDDAKIHPDLVSWEKLSPGTQQYDIEAVDNMLKLKDE